MSRIIIYNQAIYNGLIKDLAYEKAAILQEEYTDSEIKAISKFLNDWFKGTYIYGSDAMEVVGSVTRVNERNEDNPTVDEKTLKMFGIGPGLVYNEIFG